MEKMRCIVSACLLGVQCRYNAEAREYTELTDLLKNYEVVPVCPEVDGGLPTPRPPAEIREGTGNDVINGRARIINCNGEDVTTEFIVGAQKTLKTVKRHSPCKIILKSRSPSCGSSMIYDGSFSGQLIAGDGATAALLKESGFEILDENQALTALKKQ